MQLCLPSDARALGAVTQCLLAVVTAGGTRAMRPLEQQSLQAIGDRLLDAPIVVDAEARAALPHDLEQVFPDPQHRLALVRLLSCLPLVGGQVDAGSAAVVEEAARRLAVPAGELCLLRHAQRGQHKRFMWRIVRNAAVDFWGKGGRPGARAWWEIVEQALIPGRLTSGRLARRYQALERLPRDTLGGAIHAFYRDHGWALPGEPGGMPEWFVVHECTHILSGYEPTTPHGEMLTAVFTAGAKKRNAMDWVMVPLMQWHVGANVASLRDQDAVHTGLLQPDAFFRAWRRGMDMRISLMDDAWSWWDVIDVPVEQLRSDYNIQPA